MSKDTTYRAAGGRATRGASFHTWEAAAACILSLAGVGSAAHAESARPSAATAVLEEIVVTARRREESSIDVPMTMTVADQDELTNRAVRTIADLSTIAPGLNVSRLSGRQGQAELVFAQRGQGQSFGGSAPGVATYFAEVPDFASQIYDLDTVAVLKGPQGTLFGRNTTGGAVLLTPKRPDPEWNGYIVGRAGEFSRADTEFGFGGPIGDHFGIRLSGQYLSRDGYARNLATGRDVQDENKGSFRASVVWQPNDWFENYTIFQYQRTKEGGSDSQVEFLNLMPSIVNPLNPTLPGSISLGPDTAQALADQQARGPRRIDVDGGADYYFRSNGVINTTSIDVRDDLTVRNIFSYRKHREEQLFDFDGSNQTIGQTFNPLFETTDKTEELQAQWHRNRFDLTTGVYYEKKDTPRYTQFDFTTFWPAPGPVPPQGVYHAYSLDVFAESESLAFYAETTIRLTDRLDFTVGARHTHDEREGGNSTALEIAPGVVVPAGVAYGEVEFDETTWNVAALYRLTDSLNVYGTVRRGYKAGGVNTTTTGTGIVFEPEFVTDYEVGAKYAGSLGGWAVQANLDVFYDDYTDIQRAVVQPTLVVSTITQNAAAADIAGTDVELTLSPNDWFTLGIRYTYLHSEYDSYQEPVFGDLSDGLFPSTPKHQGNVDVLVHLPMPEGLGRLSARADYYYQSKTAFNVNNTPNGNPLNDAASVGSIIDAYSLLNLRLDWSNVLQSDFSVSLYATNVTDEEYVVGHSNLLAGPTFTGAYSYGAPRMIGVEGRLRF